MACTSFAILCLSAVFGTNNAAFNPSLITLNLGRLVGVQEFSEDGTPYYSFKGIRYGEPPVGQLRFQPPMKAAPVSRNTYVNATAFGPACTQITRHPPTLRGAEDCLLVNVHTPSTQPGPLYPVVAFIHGGGFMYGKASQGPERVVARGIVMVTIQYRVGVLGFLSSGDQDLPGNYGLLDQQLALKWIQKNIHEFCGDRNRVTLAGNSAGGVATTLHMASPGSRGLFHGAIPISGAFLNAWSSHKGDIEKVREVARIVGCRVFPSSHARALLPCLRKADANELAKALIKFQGWQENPFAPFGPVVDGNFLPDDPYQLLLKGQLAKVPLLLSAVTAEGNYAVADFSANRTALAELDRNWNEIAPLLLDYKRSAPSKRDQDYTSWVTRRKYLGDARINTDTVDQLIQLQGDRHFVAGIDQFAKALASVRGSPPIYMFLFAYRGEFSLSQVWADSPINRGPAHADDVNLILPRYYPLPPLRTQADKNMARSMVDIWESFIKTGVPTTADFPVWDPVPTSGDRLTFLNISAYNIGSVTTLRELGYSSFWQSLPLREIGLDN